MTANCVQICWVCQSSEAQQIKTQDLKNINLLYDKDGFCPSLSAGKASHGDIALLRLRSRSLAVLLQVYLLSIIVKLYVSADLGCGEALIAGQSITEKQAFTATASLESPVNLTCLWEEVKGTWREPTHR